MPSAVFWVSLFLAALIAAKVVRNHVRKNQTVRAWYERVIKERLDLIKKIAIFGTMILWAAIWLITRGEEKASIGSLLEKISNAWTSQDRQVAPVINKK